MAKETVRVKDCVPVLNTRVESDWWKKDRPEHGVYCDKKESYDRGPSYMLREAAFLDAVGRMMNRHCSLEATREVDRSPGREGERIVRDQRLISDPMPVVDTYQEVKGDRKCYHVLVSWKSFQCAGKIFECKPD